MINFESLFVKNNGNSIIYDSKELVLLDRISVKENQKIKISFDEINSEWRQGIVIKTKGTIVVNGKEIKNSIVLWYDTAPKEINIQIKSKNNEIIIYNVWDVGNGTMHYWHNGAAMWVEKKENVVTYHCNDGYPDSDLNDLIFTLTL
ncbi:MAG: hypothetical protein WAQ28_04010 [Bacteroidia bacterium]